VAFNECEGTESVGVNDKSSPQAREVTMHTAVMTKHNVERIASRIVANELEFRDFRVTDLNKDGLSANT
jgi:hypothetical protein